MLSIGSPPPAISAIRASGTTPWRPSVLSRTRSPASSVTSVTSISGSSPPASARVTMFRHGCWRAARAVMAPARTCSSTHE